MAYIKVSKEDGRITALSRSGHLGEGSIEVENLDFIAPGTSYQWRYVDGEFIHEPFPTAEPEHTEEPEPTPSGNSDIYDELAAAIREGVNSYGQ